MRASFRHRKTILIVVVALMIGVIIVELSSRNQGGGRRGFRNGFQPGETEVAGPLTIRHLKDGVFLTEQGTNGLHHFLIEGPLPRFELKPAGLELTLIEKRIGFIVTKREVVSITTQRQPQEWVVGYLNVFGPERPEPTPAETDEEVDPDLQSALDETGWGLLTELDTDKDTTRFQYNDKVKEAVENSTAETTVWDIFSARR